MRSFQFKLFAAFFNKIRNVFVPSDSRKFRSYAGKFWLNYVGAVKSMHSNCLTKKLLIPSISRLSSKTIAAFFWMLQKNKKNLLRSFADRFKSSKHLDGTTNYNFLV